MNSTVISEKEAIRVASEKKTHTRMTRDPDDARGSKRVKELTEIRRDLVEANEGSLIAIVGMAGRFPGAADIEAFWSNLANGVESIRFFTREECEAAGMPGALFEYPDFVAARGVLDNVDAFDAAFFGYSPREAELLDPQQRIFLECVWEALERAGCDPERFKGPIGIYGGQSLDQYMFNVMSRRDLVVSAGGGSALIGLGQGSDYLTMRVSYKLNLRGPSVNMQAGCSTSLLAVHAACQGLQNYECDMALAGGVSVMHPRAGFYKYEDGGLLSPDGHVRVFDANARGTVFSEGVGVVVMRRLSDALAEGDRIWAVIRGTAVNNDGFEKASFTSPSAAAQAELIAQTQAIAGVAPETINYVELHGTATVVGDPIEASALCQAFQGVGHRQCAVGSVKTNIGHLNHASGIAGLIKTTLAIEHRQIPPSLNFKEPNPAIDLENGPLYVNTELREWTPRAGLPRRAGVSSFGIGGTNAHVILEEAPPVPESGRSRDWQLILLSAKRKKALDEATTRLGNYLEGIGADVKLADVAFTLQLGRQQFAQRRAVLCRTAAEANAALRGGDGARRWTGNVAKGETPAVIFMFPGQGTQYPNMGRDLYRSEHAFRQTVDECCDTLQSQLEFDLRTVLFPGEGGEAEAAARLKQTSVTQPALFVIEYALARLWMSWGVRPAAMIGHSIGELVAACVSGVLELADALRLVSIRGQAMEQAPTGVMLSVGLTEEQALRHVGDGLWLAAVNAESACVMSGTEAAVAELERRLRAEDVPTQRLETSHAFHSGLMDGAVEPLMRAAAGLKRGAVGVPYVSNVTGDWVSGGCLPDAAYWASHMREPVRFHRGVETLCSKIPGSVFLEVGPGHALSRLVRPHKARRRDAPVVTSLRGPREDTEGCESVTRALGEMWVSGVTVDWDAYSADQRRRKVELPTYPFDRKKYWIAKSEAGHSRPVGLAKESDVSRWFYQPYWQPAPVPRRAADENMPARWLIVGEDTELGTRIGPRLRDAGVDVVTVRSGESFHRIDDSRYAVSPSSSADFAQLVSALSVRNWVPEVVVHGWGVSGGNPPKVLVGYDRALLDRCFYSLLSLVQALSQKMPGRKMRIEVVTDMAQQVSDQDAFCALKGTTTALCLVIPQEMSEFTCRHVDVAYERDEASREVMAGYLLSELSCAPAAASVAYRSGRRWVRKYEPAKLPATPVAELPLRERGLYLITGGLGNIGLTIANNLVDLCRGRLILTGRSGLPDRSEWDDAAAPWRKDPRIDAKVRLMQDFERRGAEVMVAAVDVKDANAMTEVVERAERAWGPLCGVVHAAGVMDGTAFQVLEGLRPEDCEQVFGPKIHGTLALAELVETRSVDFCLLVSSLSVVLGGLGNGAYASANAYLDAFAATRRTGGGATRWVSTNWDWWNFEGENMAQGSAAARFAMTPQEGVEANLRILGASDLTQVVVSTSDLEMRLAQWVNPAAKVLAQEQAEGEGAGLHERPELDDAYVAPRNETEEKIAQLWTTLLAIERVGIHDNFVDLGGHSLLAAQLLARLRGTLQIELTLDDVFRRPTVAEQAELVAERSATTSADVLDASLMDRLEKMSDAERKAMLEEARRSRSEAR
jgi:acyl transferase domain-containing protein